ncbi:MAG TPA: hypothetical protein VGV39_11970 [Mesorhizobium sp.]|jgi:hypothetical protein|uniref:hypothetical protein n=1 Tax=Mesorhizobium sp. TaxID=1871066 RepID=UPI002DDD7479|nr:hypothetical protein [Mesorhizobium sp.]HEV2503785.1 hypothetical protein [Mesorhizobium sp.]
MRSALLIAVLVTTSATADPIRWTTSTCGGSTIDIPQFMTESAVRGLIKSGEEEPYGTVFQPEGYLILLRQYYMEYSKRPYRYISGNVDNINVTYKIDKPNVGIVSGSVFGGKEIFFGMCTKSDKLHCFDVFYSAKEKAKYGPIVKRIAKSFRESSRGCL